MQPLPRGRQCRLGIGARKQSGGGLAGNLRHCGGDAGLTEEVDHDRTCHIGECPRDGRVGDQADDDVTEVRGDPRRGSAR